MKNNGPKYINNRTAIPIPSTGLLLSEVVKKRNINKAALARIMERHYNTVDDYFKNGSIQTSILWEISMILKHNFFADIAAQLPPEFGGAKDVVITEQAAEIAALKAALASLQKEKELLLQIIKK